MRYMISLALGKKISVTPHNTLFLKPFTINGAKNYHHNKSVILTYIKNYQWIWNYWAWTTSLSIMRTNFNSQPEFKFFRPMKIQIQIKKYTMPTYSLFVFIYYFINLTWMTITKKCINCNDKKKLYYCISKKKKTITTLTLEDMMSEKHPLFSHLSRTYNIYVL